MERQNYGSSNNSNSCCCHATCRSRRRRHRRTIAIGQQQRMMLCCGMQPTRFFAPRIIVMVVVVVVGIFGCSSSSAAAAACAWMMQPSQQQQQQRMSMQQRHTSCTAPKRAYSLVSAGRAQQQQQQQQGDNLRYHHRHRPFDWSRQQQQQQRCDNNEDPGNNNGAAAVPDGSETQAALLLLPDGNGEPRVVTTPAAAAAAAAASRTPASSDNIYCSSNSSSGSSTSMVSSLERVLRDQGCLGARLATLHASQLPVTAEIFVHGQSVLARITAIILLDNDDDDDNNNNNNNNSCKLAVEYQTTEVTTTTTPTVTATATDEKKEEEGESSTSSRTTSVVSCIVDFGQVTTIWHEEEEEDWNANNNNNETTEMAEQDRHQNMILMEVERLLLQSTNAAAAAAATEAALDRLYDSRHHLHRVGVGNNKSNNNKKERNDDDLSQLSQLLLLQPQQRAHVDAVLKKVAKAGGRGHSYSRLVDSIALAAEMPQVARPNKNSSSNNNNNALAAVVQRAAAARILAQDAGTGGRFKRWPCICVSATTTTSTASINDNSNDDKNANITSTSVCYVNGGWLVTDQSVRAGTEARKFVEKHSSVLMSDTATTASDDVDKRRSSSRSSSNKRTTTRTVADERITRRLECLAMGELFLSSTSSTSHDNNEMHRYDRDSRYHARNRSPTLQVLELDVRETLKALGLPMSSDGARQALVRSGRWSGDAAKQERFAQAIQPWSRPILEAATWFADTVAQRQDRLLLPRRPLDGGDDDDGSNKNNCNSDKKRAAMVDLTQLPCISVDAKAATFRDDAFGVRDRAATGRKVVPGASKWEILVHIADVSDIYVTEPQQSDYAAAERYLSELRTAAESRGTSRYDLPLGPLHLLPPVVLRALAFPDPSGTTTDDRSSCRCVTLWAYIDERDGKLLDAGIERTIVATPMKLSFADATAVMEGSSINTSKDTGIARAIMLVAERNLKKWSEYQRQRSEAAQKRETRLAARETLARNAFGNNNDQERDDGTDGFRRTRGHRLVDAALDLYSFASTGLLRRANAPVPRAIGADASRGGRVATAPLRRYIDGQAQKQLLAVLCDYGRPMSMAECKEAAKVADNARNSIANVRSVRKN